MHETEWIIRDARSIGFMVKTNSRSTVVSKRGLGNKAIFEAF